MSAQHTPGKWEVRQAPYGFDIVSVPPLVCGEYERGLIWVASVTKPVGAPIKGQFYPDAAECEANGHVLAAAPDLLERARALIEPFADISDDFLREIAESSPGNLTIVTARGITAHFAVSILAARAAIAKAEGRL